MITSQLQIVCVAVVKQFSTIPKMTSTLSSQNLKRLWIPQNVKFGTRKSVVVSGVIHSKGHSKTLRSFQNTTHTVERLKQWNINRRKELTHKWVCSILFQISLNLHQKGMPTLVLKGLWACILCSLTLFNDWVYNFRNNPINVIAIHDMPTPN